MIEAYLATVKDIEQICKLYSEFFAYNAELQPEYCNAVKESGEYPRSVIADGNADIFIALDGDIIVGFVHIRAAQTPPFASVAAHNYAEIADFFVTASYRGKGVGAKLMGAAKGWSRVRRFDYIELSVLSNAKGALYFYENNDFVVAAHTMRCPL